MGRVCAILGLVDISFVVVLTCFAMVVLAAIRDLTPPFS